MFDENKLYLANDPALRPARVVHDTRPLAKRGQGAGVRQAGTPRRLLRADVERVAAIADGAADRRGCPVRAGAPALSAGAGR